MSLKIEARKELKQKLRFGDLGKVVKITGLSRQTIDRWFEGNNNHDEIATVINTIVDKRKDRLSNNLTALL
jgi:DNA-binding phage protein